MPPPPGAESRLSAEPTALPEGLADLPANLPVDSPRPTSAPVAITEVRFRRSLWARLAGGIGSLFTRLGDVGDSLHSPCGGRLLDEFADVIAAARVPEEVEGALVRVAGVLADAWLVELMLDRDVTTQPDPKRIALWPEQAEATLADKVTGLGYPLCLGLWCGDHYQMTLQLYARPGSNARWPRRVVRRLTTLCAIAAAAERGLHAGRRARHEAQCEAAAAVRDATFLNAILPYALSQAHRHREPLTIFCLEIDRLGAVVQHHGKPLADLAMRKTSEAVARTLRGSDVVARLDDDRIVVVLPNTPAHDAVTVATVVRSALAAACQTLTSQPELSVSIGVASFPQDGHEMIPLLDAADEAMHRARARGRNQIASASPAPQPPSLPAAEASPPAGA